jgi:hypothetical protein
LRGSKYLLKFQNNSRELGKTTILLPHVGKLVAIAIVASCILSRTSSAEEGTLDLVCTATNGERVPLNIDTQLKRAVYGEGEFQDGASTKQDGKQYVQIGEAKVIFGSNAKSFDLDRYSGVLTIVLKCVGSSVGDFLCGLGLPQAQYSPIHCVKKQKQF